MSFIQDVETLQDTLEDVIFPASDLLSDEPPLETELHLRQMVLLIQCLEWWWRDRLDFYSCGNLTVYYSPRQLKSEQFRGPDFFVVLGTERKPRKSWVVWEEDGKYPHVIVEILSPKTADTDRGLKKQIYQDIFRRQTISGLTPITLSSMGFTYWMVATRNSSPIRMAGCGASNWSYIWVFMSQSYACLQLRGS